MSSIRISLAVLIVALLSVVAAGTAAAAIPVLKGTVGPGFTITLTKAGKKVTKLKAGRYKIVVTDKSSIHNFHLTGHRFTRTTTVAGKGTSTWKVRLKKGTYKYMCDPHAFTMKGSFTVK